MSGKIRNVMALTTLSLAAVAGASGVASAGTSDNSHTVQPKIDCRSNSYGAAAVLSPTYNIGPQDNSHRQCGVVDQANHPSPTTVLGLLNVT
ncbi:hypothetical protein [Streptomyces fumanus]|uniref:Secreted protein n=1 Tax=Streptomyces fumanus TaxID=67302 RepID=A0A919AD10_9ACTN|nr:hypothetical protein [Streptomyces fumanus]GHE98515.1 hypothetical protein GCM10018772_23680 [Streptomyces fumanus]